MFPTYSQIKHAPHSMVPHMFSNPRYYAMVFGWCFNMNGGRLLDVSWFIPMLSHDMFSIIHV